MNAPLPLLLAAAALAPAVADELTLANGGKLSGRVLAIEEDGRLLADLAIGRDPVELRADRVRGVVFEPPDRLAEPHNVRLHLINDDVLPCEISAIDEEALTVRSHAAGTVRVPREVVRRVQLGVRPQRLIYQGPAGIDDWEIERNWRYDEGGLTSEGRGSVHRKFKDLPDSFSLSFQLDWEQYPSFQLYFCSPSENASRSGLDRYTLQCNGSQLTLSRQTSERNRTQALAAIPGNFRAAKRSTMQVEIRVDRELRALSVFLNGELEGRFPDPFPEMPDGKFVVLQTNLSKPEALRLSNVRVREWDSASERHESADQGEPDADALIDDEGQRFGGRILRLAGDDEPLLLFKTPHYPEPLEVPFDRVSILLFKRADIDTPADPPLVLRLFDAGSLAADRCSFDREAVTLEHPLLGPLELQRASVKELTRPEAGEADEDASDS